MRKVLSAVILTLLVCTCACLVGDVFSQTPQDSQPGKTPAVGSFQLEGDKVGNVGKVLFIFLVLSVVFEVALTPIFNWRVFMAHFEERGWKTPITVALAFVVFWSYGLDIISDLLTALGNPTAKSLGGQILTALLIAGGSSGVFQIFAKLGIRMNTEERKKKAEEAKRKIPRKKGGPQET